MGASLGWERYTGDEGDILAIDRFGASAPGEKLCKNMDLQWKMSLHVSKHY